MLEVHLEWQGPFSLATVEGRSRFSPPAEGGVYLWCVGGEPNLRVAYVGQASELRKRFYEHLFWALGGACELYADDHLIGGQAPVPEYQPGLEKLLARFLSDHAKYSAMAFQNIMGYRLYWAAAYPGDEFVRCCIESALIDRCRKNNEPLQNVRSKPSVKCLMMEITSSFANGQGPAAIRSPIRYGKIESVNSVATEPGCGPLDSENAGTLTQDPSPSRGSKRLQVI